MKSIVLKSLRQPKSDLQFSQNFEPCIFAKCDLKSIKGYDFCYRHFKSSGSLNGLEKRSPAKTLLAAYKESLDKKSDVSVEPAGIVLSEPTFLYIDLLKRKTFEDPNGTKDCSSEEDSSGKLIKLK